MLTDHHASGDNGRGHAVIGHDHRVARLGQHVGHGLEVILGQAGGLGHLVRGVLGGEKPLQRAEAVAVDALARSDQVVGHAQQEIGHGVALDRHPLVADGGGVVLHRTGVDVGGAGILGDGMAGLEGVAEGHGGPP